MKDAKEYLGQVRLLDELIQNKAVEAYQLRCLATSCTAPTDREPMGSGGVSDRVGNIVAKLVDLENETNRIIDQYIDLKQEVIQVIESVKNPLWYTILHKYYIQYKTFVQIADEEGYAYPYVCEIHGKAIAEVQKILDGR